MLTQSERHLRISLQAQLDYLTNLSQARENARWQALCRRTADRLAELAVTDPVAHALLTMDIPTRAPRKEARK